MFESITQFAGTSCSNLLSLGYNTSGLYYIDPQDDGSKYKVYCDMETSGGGWTLALRISSTDGLNFQYSDSLWTSSSTYGSEISDKLSDLKSSSYVDLSFNNII